MLQGWGGGLVTTIYNFITVRPVFMGNPPSFVCCLSPHPRPIQQDPSCCPGRLSTVLGLGGGGGKCHGLSCCVCEGQSVDACQKVPVTPLSSLKTARETFPLPLQPLGSYPGPVT